MVEKISLSETEPAIARGMARWRIVYVLVVALLFFGAAYGRFSIPQTPLADTDFGYLLPALSKLGGGSFEYLNGVNFLYPGFVYLLLRTFGDFRALGIVQHMMGLAAGTLFLAAWHRLSDFLPKHRGLHRWLGLFGVTIYLFANHPIVFESQIRPDAICMFFEMLMLWLTVQFFFYRSMAPNSHRAIFYALMATVVAILLAALKPSFLLASAAVLAPVVWMMLTLPGRWRAKLFVVGSGLVLVVGLHFLQAFFTRDDDQSSVFLPETLFAVHAKIIHAQMLADLAQGESGPSSPDWLRTAANDLEQEIERSNIIYPGFFPSLGFSPDYLMSGERSVLEGWRRQLGDEHFLAFVRYWYRHSLARRPLAFAAKIGRQLTIFYSTTCPAFNLEKKIPVGFSHYSVSYSAASQLNQWPEFSKVPSALVFLDRTEKLRSSDLTVDEMRAIHFCKRGFRRGYLAILFLGLALAGWVVSRRKANDPLRPGAFLVFVLYSANFGSVLGISIVHSMDVVRYSSVQFIAALLAELWATRWLLEICLDKFKDRKI